MNQISRFQTTHEGLGRQKWSMYLLLACIKVRLPLCLLTVESRLQTQEPFFKLENLQIDDMFWRINVFEWFIVFLLICPLSLACMTVGGPTLLLRRAPLLQCNCTAGSETFSWKLGWQIKKVEPSFADFYSFSSDSLSIVKYLSETCQLAWYLVVYFVHWHNFPQPFSLTHKCFY